MVVPALLVLAETVWKLARHFGALLFIPLGFLDNSVIPMPGSFDALLIFLVAGHKQLAWYYVGMATLGSVLGAYPTYKLGVKGGEKALDEKLGEGRAKKINKVFEKWGFWSIFFGAVAPPPVPTAAFIAAAGAMKYSARRFVIALALGRIVRFGIVAWITMRYGRNLFNFFSQYYKPALFTLITLAIIAGVIGIIYYRKARHKRDREQHGLQPEQKAA